MAKPQRRNINDALADLVAQAPVGRDHVVSDNAPGTLGPRIDVGRENVVHHVGRDNVSTSHLSAGTDDDGYRIRIRREKPHVSLYAHPRVFAAIRDLAVAQRKKPHDLYAEGLRLMLAKYGLDFDELDAPRREAGR